MPREGPSASRVLFPWGTFSVHRFRSSGVFRVYTDLLLPVSSLLVSILRTATTPSTERVGLPRVDLRGLAGESQGIGAVRRHDEKTS